MHISHHQHTVQRRQALRHSHLGHLDAAVPPDERLSDSTECGQGRVMRQSPAIIVALVAATLLALVAGLAVPRPQAALAAGGEFFPETGHTLSGPLLAAW